MNRVISDIWNEERLVFMFVCLCNQLGIDHIWIPYDDVKDVLDALREPKGQREPK